MPVFELLKQGGWTMGPIYLCSVVAMAVFLHKLWEFYRCQLGRNAWLSEVVEAVHADRVDEALATLDKLPHPGARMLEAALKMAQKAPARAEAEAKRVGSQQIQKLESQLGLLSFIAQVAPLLGLLGTVLGMVDLFLGLQGAGIANVNVGALSSGIWKALLTTAAGLMVAVPTLAAHAYLTSRTDRLRLMLSDAAQQLINALHLAPEENLPATPKPEVRRSSEPPKRPLSVSTSSAN